MQRTTLVRVVATAAFALLVATGCAGAESSAAEEPAATSPVGPAATSPVSPEVEEQEAPAEDRSTTGAAVEAETPPEDSDGPNPLGAKEQAWLDSVAEGSMTLREAFEALAELRDSGAAAKAFAGDAATRSEIAAGLATVEACATLLHAGESPTKRLRPIDRLVRQGCAHYRTASILFVRGFEERDLAALRTAAGKVAHGSKLLRRATEKVTAILELGSGS